MSIKSVNVSRRSRRFQFVACLAAATLPWSLADQTAEPQVDRALDALSPFDVKLRARPQMTVGEAYARE